MPTTQTRLPLSSKPWAQLAEWKTLPRKSANPGKSGMDGSLSGPVAQTSTGAAYSSPSTVRMCQRSASASQRASATEQPKRRWPPISKRSTHWRM